MNITEAKQIPLTELLEQLGHSPTRQRGDELTYLSPFREEKTGSFAVNQSKNLWFDYGEWKGGSTIDFVLRLFELTSVSDAISKIEDIAHGSPSPSPQPSLPPRAEAEEKPPWLKLTSSGPLKARSLISYVKSRAIEPDIATRYLKEVHYLCGNRPAIALGLENQSGGFEIRDPKEKRCLGSKDMSVIEGSHDRVWLFEGMFDFLSAASMFGGSLDGTVIVLNGVGMKERAVKLLQEISPRVIELYPHDDPPGRQLTEYFRQALPESSLVDWSELYTQSGFNDLNDWYQSEKQSHRTRG